MKQTDLERFFKLFTNQEAEDFFDAALKRKKIDFVKREIPDSKFSEYFFHKNDLPTVEAINEELKIKEVEDITSRKHNKAGTKELIITLLLIIFIIFLILQLPL